MIFEALAPPILLTAIACVLGCTNCVVWVAPMLKLDQSMTTSSDV